MTPMTTTINITPTLILTMIHIVLGSKLESASIKT